MTKNWGPQNRPQERGCVHGHDQSARVRNEDGRPWCRDCHRERSEARRAKRSPEQVDADRATARATQRRRARKLRLDVLAAYGGSCACCGVDVPEFLSVDHVNNDGAAHRKVIGEGSGEPVCLAEEQRLAARGISASLWELPHGKVILRRMPACSTLNFT